MILMEEQVILVNEKDEPIGLMGKMEAHEKGLLHRAFSVFIFNSKQEVLLQQRASFSTANRREFLAPTILDYRYGYFHLTLICRAS